jgi:hypothetical protein
MSFGGPEFVLSIIAISTLGWVITSWIRAKHGYPVENEWWGSASKEIAPDALAHIQNLTAENRELRELTSKLRERVENLERIAIDPGIRTALEIESLRTPK